MPIVPTERGATTIIHHGCVVNGDRNEALLVCKRGWSFVRLAGLPATWTRTIEQSVELPIWERYGLFFEGLGEVRLLVSLPAKPGASGRALNVSFADPTSRIQLWG